MVAGVEASNNGVEGWNLVGAIAEGALYGGAFGAAAGALIGLAPTIGAFVGSAFAGTAGAGSAVAVAVSSAYVVAAGATAALGMGILLSEIPMQGTPNSFIQNGDSFGEYDADGNLMYRTDTGHKHFIKKLQQYFQPHTHHFNWQKINGIWRYIETILPR